MDDRGDDGAAVRRLSRAGQAQRDFGYGYLLWLLPWGQRQFAMFGDFGQRICVDPVSKIVLVQTGLEGTPEIWKLWLAALKRFS